MPTQQPPRKAVANVAAAKKAVPVSRTQLSPEEKQKQQLLAKIKRLNVKLSRVKDVAVNMSNIASRTNEVSSRELELYAKRIIDLLNG